MDSNTRGAEAPQLIFGDVGLDVNTERGDCVVHTHQPGPVGPAPKRFMLHSVEEIDGALQAWAHRGDTTAMNMRAALRHARQALAAAQRGGHRHD
jgi:hypothetical protein